MGEAHCGKDAHKLFIFWAVWQWGDTPAFKTVDLRFSEVCFSPKESIFNFNQTFNCIRRIFRLDG